MSCRIAYACLQATREGQASYAHVHEMIAGLAEEGWSITLFEPDYPAAGSPGVLARLLAFVRVQTDMATRIGSFDLVYLRAHFALLPIAALCRILRVPVVQEVNGPFEDLYIAWPGSRRFAAVFEYVARLQYTWCDALITVTDGLGLWLGTLTSRSDIHVIPNGANVQLFHPYASTSRALPARYVIFHGAFAEWQGVATILHAVGCLEWPHDVSVVFAGSGVLGIDVINAAALDSRVLYLGVVPYADLPGVISGAIAGLVPKSDLGGRRETGLSPLKLYEILACGVPAIVTDLPGQADLVRQSNCGVVIPPEDPCALAEAVAALAADSCEASRLGRIGREVAVAEHSWQIRALDTHIVLMQALGRSSAPE